MSALCARSSVDSIDSGNGPGLSADSVSAPFIWVPADGFRELLFPTLEFCANFLEMEQTGTWNMTSQRIYGVPKILKIQGGVCRALRFARGACQALSPRDNKTTHPSI